MQIGVYTIALNEEKFAERWARSVNDAEVAFVADTGSTDATVDILRELDVEVRRITVRPWRFDDARNAALALLPDDLDVVISLDMDEILVPGWRAKLEQAWQGTRMDYGFVWSQDLRFMAGKITGRFTHRWKHPVHEVLVPTVPEVVCVCRDVLIEHHADSGKSRGHYFDLLKLAVAEDPVDPRNAHYLAREHYYRGQWQVAIDEFKRHLALPGATWAEERASSMRYIAKCHAAIGDQRLAYQWVIRAVLEDGSRESLIDAAKLALEQKRFHSVIDLCERALAVPQTQVYMAERYANHEGPYDLAAVAYSYLGERGKALALATEAIERNPDDPRLQSNLEAIKKAPAGEAGAE